MAEPTNKQIAFIDTEIDLKTRNIIDIGGLKDDGSFFHKPSAAEFVKFLNGIDFICGHNIIRHDLKYLGNVLRDAGIDHEQAIDTLYLSPLLFPTNPYHNLLKDDKLQSEEANNPLNDSIKAKDLFYDEVSAFRRLEQTMQQVFYALLNDQPEFSAFFKFVSFSESGQPIEKLIYDRFGTDICQNVDLANLVSEYPVALAYSLSLIDSFIRNKNVHSITPPWVLANYPDVERIMFRLRNRPCVSGCQYCDSVLDVRKGLRRFFGFESYRTFDGESLQEKAVKAAVNNKSILAVFPTGGGKSITFQVPALISGESSRALTIVISPLQSLMKDQVDNLEKIGITGAVTINGMLDPIERTESFRRVGEGLASILYISPESLRSKTIEKLILGRKIARFVIDEAHCFSSWGQDFRVDYLYIADFIKLIQKEKRLQEGIPVSCFTATAKRKVIEDIQEYFNEKLALDLELFTSKTSRANLRYEVFEKADEEEKYLTARQLIEEKKCPTIIYVSRTYKAFKLAERLCKDGFEARPYHGKMDAKEKAANQNAFIAGEVPIMVATSAFGMGVDKKDVGMVIHYEISDSLENYIQEAGRAGRDENITADCFVLFNEEDLSKHFILLNQTKLSIKEIQQIWKAIKGITKFRSKVSNSVLEIARKAGWDDNVLEIETRVKTAIAALEDAGYLRRGQNMPQIFANSILSKNAQEAIDKINASEKFEASQKAKAIRIIKKLFSSRSRKPTIGEVAESRVDYISDHLGMVREEVIKIITLLRDENILADAKDLTAFIKRGENENRSLRILETFARIENFLLPFLTDTEQTFHIKALNEDAETEGCIGVNPARIKTVFNFWAIKNWIQTHNVSYSKNHVAALALRPGSTLAEKLGKRHEIAKFIIGLLYERSNTDNSESEADKEEVLVDFSVHELKLAYENSPSLFKLQIDLDDIEDALFYLTKIEALKIEGGFLVTYNRLTIERLEKDNYKKYTLDDYKKLNQFYENKIQQIHIVGEYAKKMIDDYKDALQFVEDYFNLNYTSFLRKYFPGSRVDDLRLKMTPGKFKQLFGDLSPAQLNIIKDNETKHIAVAAGPGSGKTRVLVHKLASLLLMEDVKHEQLLMVTFSRAAATEFKKRLVKLIGNAAHFVEIKTFHSYCFDLLGRVGSLEKSNEIIKKTIEKIQSGEVEPNRITKTVLVIDEAQDMNKDEYDLILALMESNEEMRVIAVGDDDQNIYEFRGANSKYLEHFITVNGATKHELIENYRSKGNLVDFSNQFVQKISHRLKHLPITAMQLGNGKIKVVRHQSGNLITPIVNEIIESELTGNTCVLAKTNEEASKIAGLLLKSGLQAKLIQSNDGFNLYDLVEIRYFLNRLNMSDGMYVIHGEVWENAKRDLSTKFQRSSKLEICNNIITEYESSCPPKKYISDLEAFIRESKLEDFYGRRSETIFVSTIHKAKGKEFDNVYLLLENFDATTDEAKRQLYVAMTRAKSNLTIHLNSSIFDNLATEGLVRRDDTQIYSAPKGFAVHLTYEDVYLDYFDYVQHRVGKLFSGDSLRFKDDGCATPDGEQVLKFSRRFREWLDATQAKGYVTKAAKVNYILYWLKDGAENEIKVLLPELYFERNG